MLHVSPTATSVLWWFSGYTLTYEKKNETITKVTRELGPAVTNYTITGLTATTHYTVVISARTRVGSGPATSADVQSGIPPGQNHMFQVRDSIPTEVGF